KYRVIYARTTDGYLMLRIAHRRDSYRKGGPYLMRSRSPASASFLPPSEASFRNRRGLASRRPPPLAFREQLGQDLVVVRLLAQARVLAREEGQRDVRASAGGVEVVQDNGEALVVRKARIVDHREIEVI